MFVTSNVLTLPPGSMKLSESESLFWGENPFPNFILTNKHLIQTNIAYQLDFFIGLFSCVLVAKSHCSCSEETSSELRIPLSHRASGTSGLFHPAPTKRPQLCDSDSRLLHFRLFLLLWICGACSRLILLLPQQKERQSVTQD